MIMFSTILLVDIAGAGLEINSCTMISMPGVYVLNSSIVDSGDLRCINIGSSNVIFDGRGYFIDGVEDVESTGVSIISPDYSQGLFNVSVINLKLTDWGTGISSEGSRLSPYGNRFGNISNNTIDSPFGIRISYSGNYTLSGNSAGMSLYKSSGNIILDNNAASKGGIHLTYSFNNILIGNNASSNEYGIYMSYAENNLIDNNIINGSTQTGIALSEPWPANNTIINNHVSNNKCGIEIAAGGSNNVISGNRIISNRNCGIYIASSGNLIYNNFFNNVKNVKAHGKNKWNIKKRKGRNIIGGLYLGGNYWGRPDGRGFSQICPDDNKDSLCDTGYKLSHKNKDHLPLYMMKNAT